jgi:hypothetical protein
MDGPCHDPRCWNCTGPLDTRVSVINGVTWTTQTCPTCGALFTSADTGQLDLGLRSSDD